MAVDKPHAKLRLMFVSFTNKSSIFHMIKPRPLKLLSFLSFHSVWYYRPRSSRDFAWSCYV